MIKTRYNNFPSTIDEIKSFIEGKIFIFGNFLKINIGKDSSEKFSFGIFKDEEENYIIYYNRINGKKEIILKEVDEEKTVETFCKIISRFVLFEKSYEFEKNKEFLFSKMSVIKKVKLFLYNI